MKEGTEEDDDGGDDDDAFNYTLRKCAAIVLDSIAESFGHELVLPILLPELQVKSFPL